MDPSIRTTNFCICVCLAAIAAVVLGTMEVSARTEAESYAQSADQLLKKGDLRGAAIELRNAVQKAPEDGDLRVKLGEVNLRLGDALAAEAAAIKARDLRVPDERVAPLLARALYAEGEYGRLLKAVPAGDRPAKVESVVRTVRGLAHLSLAENADAEVMLRDAERLDPAATAPKVALVAWLLRAHTNDEADRQADAALAISPEDVGAITAKGEVLAAQGNTRAAVDRFSAALERDPNSIPPRVDRAGAAIKQHDLDGAQKDLDIALKRAPLNIAANFLQALLFEQKNDFAKADETLTKIGDGLDQIPEGYYLAGLVKYRLGQQAQATDYLTRQIARQPNSSGAYTILGAIALRKGDNKRAIDLLQQGVKLAQRNTFAASLLAEAHMARGDVEKALEVLETATKAEPDSERLQAETALAHITEGETTAGVDELARVFQSDARNSAAGPSVVVIALRVGEFEKAVATAQELVKREPENPLYQELLGAAQLANRNLPEAERILHGLLVKKPELTTARRNLAQVYVLMHRKGDAKGLFEDALAKNANDVASLVLLAELYSADGNTAEAAKYLRRAVDASPSDPGAGLRLVSLYAAQKDWTSALATARELRAGLTQDPSIVDALARVQIASGDDAAALETYRNAVNTDVKSVPLLSQYARLLLAKKDVASARKALQSARDLAPENAQIWQQIVALEYQAAGQDGALSAARSLAASDPDNPTGEIVAARVLDANGKLQEAIGLLEKRQAEKPSPGVVVELSDLYAKAGRDDAAIALLSRWLDAHPNQAALRSRLAQIYLKNRDYDDARREFERLVSERSGDAVALDNLAWLYQRTKDPRARALAEKAYRLSPQPEMADTLGWILTTEVGPDAGLQYLEDASKARPNNPDIQYHLAFAFQKLGKVADAREVLRRLVGLLEDFDSKADAKALLSQLGG